MFGKKGIPIKSKQRLENYYTNLLLSSKENSGQIIQNLKGVVPDIMVRTVNKDLFLTGGTYYEFYISLINLCTKLLYLQHFTLLFLCLVKRDSLWKVWKNQKLSFIQRYWYKEFPYSSDWDCWRKKLYGKWLCSI